MARNSCFCSRLTARVLSCCNFYGPQLERSNSKFSKFSLSIIFSYACKKINFMKSIKLFFVCALCMDRHCSDAFLTILVQTSIDIKSETSLYSVLIVEIPGWSWILPQIATKINILTFDFLSLEYKLPFGCQKTLAGIFLSNLDCFNNLLRPNYSHQWPQ